MGKCEIIKYKNIFSRSYTVNGKTITQGGRWNTSTTNTKLFPIISYETPVKSSNSSATQTTTPALIIKKQSGNIFKSTTYHMSKKELHSYLTRNRAYLYR